MSNAKATETTKPAGFDPSKVKVLRNVTLPILKLVEDTPIYIRVTGKIHEGKRVAATGGKDGDDTPMKPADLLDVVDLTTGQEMQIVCGTVLKGTLTEEYKDHGYVDRCFMVTKGKKKDKAGGRGYFTYYVAEIADPAK